MFSAGGNVANYFIHIPRTGGSSLLESLPRGSYVYLGHDLRDRAYRHPSTWCTADDFVFAFLRDPFERLASAYFYLRNGGVIPPDNVDAYHLGLRSQSLDEFICRGLEAASTWQMHFLPQSFHVRDVPKLRMYRFTDQRTAFVEICRELGVDPPPPLQEVNVSERRTAEVRFGERAERIVREVYREDFALLDQIAPNTA